MVRHIQILLVALLASLPAPAGTSSPESAPKIEDMTFSSHGATLSGSLLLPANGPIRSAVVFIHGSGEQVRDMRNAERFARAGIAALVYDKRGVGKSGGRYEGEQNVSEANISLLADDAVAASQALAAHPSLKGVSIGFAGISQAGWIAPLAAERSKLAKFIVLWSGPVCKVSEEDIYSKYTRDTDGKTAPPYQEALNARQVKYIWPDFLGRDTDSGEDLDRLTIPGLWIFSDNDASIPVDISIARLEALSGKGHRYEYVVFAGLGHNNMDGTFSTATDWIRKQ